MRGVPEHNNVELRVANADGRNDHLLAALPDWPGFMFGAAWSPDGKTILASGLQMAKEIKWVLTAINVADGTMKELISGSAGLGRPAWSPDGNSFLISIELQPENRSQLWMVSYPGGERTRFSNDLSDYGHIAGNDSGRKDARRAWSTARARTSGSRQEEKPRKQNKLPPAKLPTTASRPAPPVNSWCAAAAATSH